MEDLTLRKAQKNQPWTLPYSYGVVEASAQYVRHILSSHCVLHVAKTVGKLGAVFEAMDHSPQMGPEQYQTVRAMSADLVVIALRLANLHEFDLQEVLEERVREKNGRAFEGPAGR